MLDTLAYAKRLRGAGFTEEQAETQASALYDAVTGLTATKLDVVEAKNEIKEAAAGEFTAVRREIGEFKEAVAGEFTAVRREIGEFKEAVAGEFTAVRREIGEFKEAVAGEFTAIRREIADIWQALRTTNGQIALLRWMVGFNLALTTAVLVKLLL
jgi:uncharacterized protein YbjT (DUF2867 family)